MSRPVGKRVLIGADVGDSLASELDEGGLPV